MTALDKMIEAFEATGIKFDVSDVQMEIQIGMTVPQPAEEKYVDANWELKTRPALSPSVPIFALTDFVQISTSSVCFWFFKEDGKFYQHFGFETY